MKKPLLVLSVAGLLALMSAAAVTLVALPRAVGADDGHHHADAEAGADEHAMHGGMAGDMHDAQLGMSRLAFPPASGSVPTAQEAQDLEELSHIQISADDGFTPAKGVRGGSGTLEDPYLITGYHITGGLYIQDTDACFKVAGNWIDGQLTLNWNGNCVHVHHNFIRDLRVNENIERKGLDTGGLIELNQINYVGQIRHFDGEFRNNVIGPRADAMLPFGIFDDPENPIPFLQDTRILNIDGWNQALFHHNTVYGSVDLKLHGHHHGTGFLATHSHYHGDDAARMMEHDHADRWTSVDFRANKVIDPKGYGLRYTDEAHAGDDRTAQSESTRSLEDDHQHHTLVTIADNVLEGAGIWVDIFNADDTNHKLRNPGWFTIEGNQVSLSQRDSSMLGTQFFGNPWEPNTAIKVWQAKEASLRITGNTLAFKATGAQDPVAGTLAQAAPWFFRAGEPTAISLEGVRAATVGVDANKAAGFPYGIRATQMDNATHWYLMGNDFQGAAKAVYYDDSVEQRPEEGPAPVVPVEQYPGAADEPTTQDRHDH